MSEKYSIDEIEAVFNEHPNERIGEGAGSVSDVKEWLIAELTKPKYVPQVGEVFVNEEAHGYVLAQCTAHKGNFKYCRPLTPDEVPAWKETQRIACTALDKLSKLGNGGRVVGNSDGNVIAAKALAKIKELVGGDMK